MLTSIPAASMHRYLRAISRICKIVENNCGQIARVGRYFRYVKPTTQQMVATLTEMFAKHDRISDAAADKLMSILDAADDETIIVFAKAKIKFVSRLAHNRAIRRGLEVR